MLIPVTLPSCSANPKLPSSLAKISHDEVVLIELQGSLDVESKHPTERNGQFVGKLKIDEATNKPTLMIGHHLLEGKIQVLSKPLAVLVRSRPPVNFHPKSISDRDEDTDSVDEDEAMAIDDSDHDGVPGHSEANGSGSGLESSGVSWTIAAVVKKKIIFSKRPMPVSAK